MATIESNTNFTGTFQLNGTTQYPLILGTPLATTSGTTKDFTSLPSGISQLVLMLDSVSTNGTSNLLVQIGDGSGGLKTTSYTSAAGYFDGGALFDRHTSTAGFLLEQGNAGYAMNAVVRLYLANSSTNLWICDHVGDNSARVILGGGRVTLSAALDRIRLTTVNGTDAFDAGAINIQYR